MNKKIKFLLIPILLLTGCDFVSNLIDGVSNDTDNEETKPIVVNTVHGSFDMSHSSFEEKNKGDNKYVEGKAENDSGTLSLCFENAFYNSESILVDNSSYLVIYNKQETALNGISKLKFEFSGTSLYESIYSVYFSYNYLTLDNIFAGHYSDLITKTQGCVMRSSPEVSFEYECLNARYFLVVLESMGHDYKVDDFSIVSDETVINEIEDGLFHIDKDYSEYFGEIDLNRLFSNGSMEIIFDDEFKLFQKRDTHKQIISKLNEFGYEMWTHIELNDVFVKKIDVSTVSLVGIYIERYESFEYMEFYGNFFDNIPAELEFKQTNYWPAIDILNLLENDEFKSLIIDPSFIGNVKYSSDISFIVNQTIPGAKNYSEISFNFNDLSEEEILLNFNLLKKYKQYFNEQGFNKEKISEYIDENTGRIEYSATLTDTGLNEIYIRFRYRPAVSGYDAYIIFKEFDNLPFPLEEIKNFCSIESFPAPQIESCVYRYRFSGMISNLDIFGLSYEEYLDYIELIKNYGFDVYGRGDEYCISFTRPGIEAYLTYSDYSTSIRFEDWSSLDL